MQQVFISLLTRAVPRYMFDELEVHVCWFVAYSHVLVVAHSILNFASYAQLQIHTIDNA